MKPFEPSKQNRLKHLADSYRGIKELDRHIKSVVDRLPDAPDTKDGLYEPIRRSLINLFFHARCLYLENMSHEQETESSSEQ